MDSEKLRDEAKRALGRKEIEYLKGFLISVDKKLSNEKFSFPGIDGLIQFNPDSIPSVDIQPKAYVDKLVLDGNLVDEGAFNNDIPANIKNIELELGISGMLSEENIVLEYKIDNGIIWSL